jgi:hypothetical protein
MMGQTPIRESLSALLGTDDAPAQLLFFNALFSWIIDKPIPNLSRAPVVLDAGFGIC